MSRKRNRHFARRTGYVFAFLVLLLAIGNYARPIPTVAANPSSVQSSLGNISLHWPSDGAGAAVGAVGYGVLESQSNIQIPTASVAKLITALTVLKAKPLAVSEQGPTITITQADVDIYNTYVAQDGSVVPVQAGETLTEYQALQAMMLPSANNIADTLALWAFGSLSNYQAAGDQEVKSLGLTNTVIGTDASGLSPSTESSPGDLVSLGSAALSNPVLAQIVDQSSVVLPIAGLVQNVNSLLGYDGIDGIKTGNSDQAGGNYLFSAPYTVGGQTVTIIGSIMHAPSLQAAMQDALPLLSSAKSNFILAKPVTAGQVFGTYTAPWGESVTAVAPKDLSIMSWKGATLTPSLRLNNLKHGLPANSQVGTISFSSNNFKMSEPVTLKRAYNSPSFWWRLTRL